MTHLLVLAPGYPWPVQNGVHIRTDTLLRRLPEGFRITLMCLDAVSELREEPLPAPFTGTCVRIPAQRATGWKAHHYAQLLQPSASMIWKFHSPEMERQTAERSRKADAVLAIGLQMGQYLPAAAAGVPRLQDNYNVEWRILSRMAHTRPLSKRWYWLLESAKLRRDETRILNYADLVVAISEVDRTEMEALVPKQQFCTVTQGMDLEYWRATGERIPGASPIFCFVGAFDWHVNQDAAAWMTGQVWPRIRAALPNAELQLVGREPSAEVRQMGNEPSVTVTGTVPDIRPYVAQSTAVLVPLRYGSGVRTKILEAFAAGRPVVTTSVGCEGLPVRHGEHVLLADDEEGFANACVQLAREPETAARMVRAGYALAQEIDQSVTRNWRAALCQALGSSICKDNKELTSAVTL